MARSACHSPTAVYRNSFYRGQRAEKIHNRLKHHRYAARFL